METLISKTHRNVPDVSLNADTNTGYSIYYDGKWEIYGGTSCAAPLWASFTACLNQKRVTNQKPVLGFANPSLYVIGKGNTYREDFHDIISGDNLHYYGSHGYDNASGWGSFNGVNLFTSLTNSGSMFPPVQRSPVLAITMTETSPFIRGKIGSYTINVSKQGNGPTSGAVKVLVDLPKNLSYRSLSGSGWTVDHTTLTCTQDSILDAESSFQPIVLNVQVDENAPNIVQLSLYQKVSLLLAGLSSI